MNPQTVNVTKRKFSNRRKNGKKMKALKNDRKTTEMATISEYNKIS